jgi:hypothetical protein
MACLAVGLSVLAGGTAAAQDTDTAKPKRPPAPPQVTTGTFVSYKDGKLVLNVKGRDGEAKPRDFKVPADTKVALIDKEGTKTSTAKEALKDAKVGTTMSIAIHEGKIQGVAIILLEP